MSYKPKVKSAPKKETYFVLWPETTEEDDSWMAGSYDSYAEAKEFAEECLIDNNEVTGLYYIAKAVEKVYFKKEVEKL